VPLPHRARRNRATLRLHRLPLLPLALATLAAGVACRAGEPSFRDLYRASRAEPAFEADDFEALDEARQERVARVREKLARGEARSREDALYAAGVLLDSDVPEDLDLARDLALDATAGGDERGFRLAAEAIDRGLLLRDLPQRYGTQYVFVPVTGLWTLHPCDPATTDAERTAMGVPTLAEARARLAVLNGS